MENSNNKYHNFYSLGTTQYQWNFGNVVISNQKGNRIFNNTPGTYLVALFVSDFLGFADTLQEFIVLIDCNTHKH